jgi:tyrosyl-DNA phosphodiesterase 2
MSPGGSTGMADHSTFVVDFVTDYDSSLYGSLLTGDLNAIEPFDTTFPSTYNLSDEHLALGGEEGMEKGFTWGYQSPAWLRDKYGCSRMDKVLRPLIHE